MRLLTAIMFASGLCAWLAGDADRPEQPGDSRPAGAVEIEAVHPGDAGEDSDEAWPPPGEQHRGGKMGDRPGRGQHDEFRDRRPFGPKFPPPEEGADDKPLSPEEIDRLMEFTRRHFPELHERLSQLRGSNPILFRQMIDRARGPMSQILHIAKDDPELAENLIELHRVEMALAELRKRYHDADSDGQREQIKADMRAGLEKRFDLRLERLRFEIRMLEKRLEEARKSLAERERNKEEFIEKELKEQLAPGKHEPPEFPEQRMHKRERDRLPPPPPDL